MPHCNTVPTKITFILKLKYWRIGFPRLDHGAGSGCEQDSWVSWLCVPLDRHQESLKFRQTSCSRRPQPVAVWGGLCTTESFKASPVQEPSANTGPLLPGAWGSSSPPSSTNHLPYRDKEHSWILPQTDTRDRISLSIREDRWGYCTPPGQASPCWSWGHRSSSQSLLCMPRAAQPATATRSVCLHQIVVQKLVHVMRLKS